MENHPKHLGEVLYVNLSAFSCFPTIPTEFENYFFEVVFLDTSIIDVKLDGLNGRGIGSR